MPHSRHLWLLPCVIGGMAVLLGPSEVFAHGVDVTARHIGETVVVDARFGNGKPVGNGIVSIFGPDDKLVTTGTTDANGRYVWGVVDVPSYLRIEVDAGLGHVGTRILTHPLLAETPDHTQHQHPTPTRSITSRNAVIGVSIILTLSLTGFFYLRKREKQHHERDKGTQ